MTRLLYRLGGAVAAHPWRTLAIWVAIAALALGAAAAVGGTPHDDYDVPGTRSQAGIEQLREQFPQMAGAGAQVVVHDEQGDPLPAQVLDALTADLAAMDHVVSVAPPRLSADGDTALLQVQYDVPVTDEALFGNVAPLQDATTATQQAGLSVLLGGEVPGSVREIGGTGELAGVLVAILLLILTFGSVVAAGLPLAGAFAGLAVGTAGITLLAAATDVSTSAPTVATMVGLGVGIDYGLLLLTRHLELLRSGLDRREAAARATATAGRSIVFAGLTVLVSLMGLRLAGLPVYSSFGYATAIVVAAAVATSITLVPALAAACGTRLLHRRERGARRPARQHGEPTFVARWAARVGRRPLPWALASLVLLGVLAAPVLGMRTWPQDAGSQPQELEMRQAFDLVAAEYGAGANGPLLLVADLDRADVPDLDALRVDLEAVDGVAEVGPAVVAPDGGAAVLAIEPAFAPSDERTTPLIQQIRADVLPPGTELTGGSSVLSDISVQLENRIWLVIAFVVALSVLLLMVMFRSVVVALKAALMNLLSIAAAYGVVVAVFQWGWGTSLVGLDHAIPVSSWVPILMFTVLFGLSMDYEVFLLSRIREDYLATGDPRGSVVRGLSATGRVISAAAAIMVAVFLGFATEADVTVAMIGVGMAAAIAIDATLVRLVLVPATMALLGRWNWWIPAWLDRLLPHVDAESDAFLTVPNSPQEQALSPIAAADTAGRR